MACVVGVRFASQEIMPVFLAIRNAGCQGSTTQDDNGLATTNCSFWDALPAAIPGQGQASSPALPLEDALAIQQASMLW